MALSAVSISRGGVSGQTTADQLILRHWPLPLADEKGKSEPPLPPGKLPLFDECLAVFDRNPPRQVDAQWRQGFANVRTTFRQ